MKTLVFLIGFIFLFGFLNAQNKDTATVSVYGYRLHEGSTYSWRNTGTYFDRTTWDSSPFTEGHLRQHNGTFRLNYRLLFPNNYDPNYSQGYPLMLVFHGAGERGNCWFKETYQECYYGDMSYNPNTSPTDATQDQINNLLNNDHNLSQGAGAHMSARNRAGSMLPDDPRLPDRAFPGFIYYPQNLNGWGLNDVRDAIRILRLLIKKYNIDQDKIYISGLSNGGRGALYALVEADWLFAAAATQSAIPDHNLYKSQIDSVVNIPMWMFQGAQDTSPLPVHTKETIRVLHSAGGLARYTEYPTLGHGTWNTAYAEPDYFSWFMSKNKSDLHVYYGNPNICGTNDLGAKLSMTQGFAAYEWERDGVVIAGATGYILVADQPGVYRGRFKRGTSWNNWSSPVNVGVQSPVTPTLSQVGSIVLQDLNGKNIATLEGPEGATNYYWYKDNVLTTLPNIRAVQVKSGDCSTGPCVNNGQYTLVTSAFGNCPSQTSNVKGVFFNNQAPVTIPAPINFTGTVKGTEVVLRWDDVSALEKNYEIWRRKETDNPSTGWTFVTLTNEDAIIYTDKGLASNTTYWYKIRGVSNTARSNYSPGNSKTVPAQNLIISTGADITPPTAPVNIAATLSDTDIATKTASLRVTWGASIDDSGLKEYRIQYGSSTITVPPSPTSATLKGLPLNQEYNITVYAVDIAGNVSPPGSPANAKTYIDGFFWFHNTGGYTDIRDIPATVWTNPEFRGRSANLTLEPRTQDDYFTLKFYGYVYVNTAGPYQFRINSNDGVELYLDGQLVARRNGLVGDGTCATTNFTNGIPPAQLSVGAHALEVRYFQYTGDMCLSFDWRGPDAGPNAGRFYAVPNERIKSYDTYTPPTLPQVPENLAAIAAGMEQINLSWTYPGTDTVEFEIQRALAEGGPFTVIKRVKTLTYADTGLLPGTTYHYRLRSVTNAGLSDFTPVVNATTETDDQVPSTPLNLTLVSKTISSASIAWTASTDNSGVAGYEIYGNGVLLAKTQFNYHLLTNLIPFSTYSVYVIAYDANNNKSAPSNTIVFETTEPVTYFSKATGNLYDLATWGTNADGSGDPPSEFNLSGLYLYISNRTNALLEGTWNVPSPTARIIVSPNVTFTINGSLNAIVNAAENSTVIVSTPNMPQFDNLALTSNVLYNQNASAVRPAKYGNLVLNGTGTKTFPTGETTVMGTLSIANGLSISGAAGNLSRIKTFGDVNFIGTRGATAQNITVGLDLAGTTPQKISTAADVELFEITTLEGGQPSLISAGTPVTLRLGSPTGGGLLLRNGSSLQIADNTVALRGAATINRGNETGVVKADNATILLASSSNLNSNIYLDSAANTLYQFSVSMTGSGTAIARRPINISHGLKVFDGIINSNGNIRLMSNALKTANLEEIENSGRVLGNLIVERFMSDKERTYRYISSPVAGTTVATWQSFFKITGSFSGATTGPGLSTAASLFTYDEPNWVPYPTTTNQAPIERGVGYAAYIRNENAFTIRYNANPYQGPVPFNVASPIDANGRWNLLGNPYASTIQWSTNPTEWQRTNISTIVAVRNNSSASSGQFMYYDAATGLGTATEGLLTAGKIAPGQAFYVQATGAGAALTISEPAKISEQQELFRSGGETISHLYLRLRNGETEDAAIVSLTDFGKDHFEAEFDGRKMANIDMFNLSTLSANAVSLAINNLSDAYCRKSVRLNLENTKPGTYTLSVEELGSLEGAGAVSLKDKYAQKNIELLETNQYTFEISEDSASYGSNRFEIILDRPQLDLSIEPLTWSACNEDAKVILPKSQSGASYSLVDKAGKAIASETGNGGELVFIISRGSLKEGQNEFQIEASFKGCLSARLSNTATVVFNQSPTVQANDASTCRGEKARLDATSDMIDARFIWYDPSGKEIKGNTSSTFETSVIETETFYFVSAEASNGCTGPKQVIVVTPVDLEVPALKLTADTLYATTVAEAYHWALNDEVIAMTSHPFLPVSVPGKYRVLCVSGSCTKTSSILEVSEFELSHAPADLSLYPNPTTSDNIHIQGRVATNGPLKISIIDVTGKEIFRTESNGLIVSEGLHLSPGLRLRAGFYFLILEENSKKRKIKFAIRE
jgi:chitodextrinase